MAGSDPRGKSDEPMPVEGELRRLRPLRVLVASTDERFRAVSSMLISRRRCEIFTTAQTDALATAIGEWRIDVVVIDGDIEWAELCAASASIERSGMAAGVVAVADEGRMIAEAIAAGGEANDASLGRLSVAKWGPFDELFDAIEQAELRRGAHRVCDGSRWPPAGVQAGADEDG
jgi:hypothetical protein